MHSQTMGELIHEAYHLAVKQSKTSIELVMNLCSNLERTKVMVTKEDKKRLETFIESLKIY